MLVKLNTGTQYKRSVLDVPLERVLHTLRARFPVIFDKLINTNNDWGTFLPKKEKHSK